MARPTLDKRKYYMGDKNLPVPDSQHEYTPHQIKELSRCYKNITYFAENYFYITTTDRGKVAINFYAPQKRIIKGMVKHRFNVILASRQSGKTTISTVYSLWETCFKADKRVLIVANKEDTAKMILQRIKMAYEQLPNWIKPGVKQWDKTEVVFENDSVISVSTTTASAARGYTINTLLIDECAHIPPHIIKEFWESVIPVISSSTTSKVLLVSTPNGTSGKFYEIYTGAESGRLKQWHHDRIDWWELPSRGKKWKQDMEDLLAEEGGGKSFAQEFNNEFIDNDQSAVDGDLISRWRKLAKTPIVTLEDGLYKIWEMPEKGHIYIIGVDVSEGVAQAASVAQVLDITDLTNIRQVACYHNNSIDPFHFAGVLYKMTSQWGRPYLMIERNNCGGQIIDSLLQVHGYDYIVQHTPDTGGYAGTRLGIYAHTNSKYTAVTNMRYWMNSLRVVEIYDINTVQEFETFVRQPNGTWKARGGTYMFDDRVTSLMWGLFILNPGLTERYFNVTQYDDHGRPLKIDNVTTQDDKYYSIEEMYGRPMGPLPVYFGSDEASKSGGVDELVSEGWTVL